MARVNLVQAAADVESVLQSSGGEMAHNALVETLEAAGKNEAAANLTLLKQQGKLTFRMVADRDTAKSTLLVSLPK